MIVLYEDSDRDRLYLKSLDVIIGKDAKSKWTVGVGDLCCLQITNADNEQQQQQQQGDLSDKTFQPVQILAIYQERLINKLSSRRKKKKKRWSSIVFVEVRYFYRGEDLKGHCSSHRDNSRVNGQQVLLESDHVEVVQASLLVGKLVLKSPLFNNDNNNSVSMKDGKSEAATVPTVELDHNHCFYLHQQNDVVQFDTVNDTIEAFNLRGIKSSRVLKENEQVLEATCNYLNLTIPTGHNDDEDMTVKLPLPTLSLQNDGKTSLNSERKNEAQKKNSPPPSLTPAADAAVAATTNTTTSSAAPKQRRSQRNKNLVAKQQSKQDETADTNYKMMVSDMIKESHTAQKERSSIKTPVSKVKSEPQSMKRKQSQDDVVVEEEDDDMPLSAIGVESTSSAKSRRRKRAKTPAPKRAAAFASKPAPTTARRSKRLQTPAAHSAETSTLLNDSSSVTKQRRSKRAKTPVMKDEPKPTPKKSRQSVSTKRKLASSLKEEASNDTIKLRVKCTKQPFYVDVSSQKSFYEEINILPPLDSYDDRFSMNRNETSKLWTVRLGDTVCIEVEQHRADQVTFPFVVSWSPAEIVAIYRAHDKKAECLELREKIQSISGQHSKDGNFFDDVMVEVRWFYHKHEIPGAGRKSAKSQSNSDGELEEIFETDQINSCPADCLLSPLKLFEMRKPSESLPSIVSGMPCMYYYCTRYWSIHRKSFIPSGVLSNRMERGRMHSKYKAALSKLPSVSNKSGKISSSQEYSWKEGFQNAIQKLSLAEAAADIQVHGMELKCRERERRHIGNFLRKAIRGLDSNNNRDDETTVMSEDGGLLNTKSSIFICGPPGTGKTASVRSIITELHEEQASGKLPEFNFISLNGMEMRSPFDSYVKFWEAISGTRKERLSAGAAAQKLEDYFVRGDSDRSNEDRTKIPINVLMLDEIDYLVTKKETILYNFFDWPLRATHARLIVIGISNTINLPERMSLKLQSRLGGERCHFKSYTVDETAQILKKRLDGNASQVFDEDAIKFASRKTGNLSGDIRKAFHMCKVAAQNALDEYSSGKRRVVVEGSHPKVKISDVQKGSRDMYTSILHKAIACSSTYETLVLIAIGALKKNKIGSTDVISLDLREILTKIESIANGSGEDRYMSARLSLGDLMGILRRLGDVSVSILCTTI